MCGVFMSKQGFFDKLERTETKAALKEQRTDSSNVMATTKPKHLNAMPTAFFKAHKDGKARGITSLDFSQYIYEAVREKLQRDQMI